MRIWPVLKTLLALFLAVAALAALLAVANRARAADDRASVSRAYHRMAVRGQVRRFEQTARANSVLQRKLKLQRRQFKRALTTRFSHPLERNFLCIHSGEGAWTSDTGNGYYGGLQMDAQFERSYGSEFVRAWGHANNWPISAQLAVGMRAYLSGRGFYPWPNTARACGLL